MLFLAKTITSEPINNPMKTHLLKLTCGLLLCGSAAQPLLGQTMTFSNAISSSATIVSFASPYTESGFTITPNSTSNGHFANNSWFPGWSYDGSAYLATGGGNTYTITSASGAFSFLSLAIGEANPTPDPITITGYLDGTQVASQIYTSASPGHGFSGAAAWSDVSLSSNFADVTAVTIQIFAAGNGYMQGLDDLTFGSVTPAPEPATLALAGLGGLSLMAFRRRK